MEATGGLTYPTGTRCRESMRFRETPPRAPACALPRILPAPPPAHACHGAQEIAGHLRRRPKSRTRAIESRLHRINVSGS